MNVLLTCVGRRHYLAKYFKQFVGDDGVVVGTDMTNSAPALVACDKRELVPSVIDVNYIPILIDICNKHEVDYVFSLNDLELSILAKNKKYIESKTKCKIVISDIDIINICNDKYETYLFADSLDIITPKTYIDINKVIQDLELEMISFPLMVKPRWGSASIGLYKVTTIDELKDAYLLCKDSVCKSFLNSISESDDSIIIQEFIEGNEYGVDILNSLSGDFINFTAKRKISMRSGETDRAVTVSQELFLDSVKKIATNLHHIGNLDCDFLEKNGKYYLLEMNARFGGGYPFTHEAGANHIEFLLAINKSSLLYTYESGLILAKCDHLVKL